MFVMIFYHSFTLAVLLAAIIRTIPLPPLTCVPEYWVFTIASMTGSVYTNLEKRNSAGNLCAFAHLLRILSFAEKETNQDTYPPGVFRLPVGC